MNVNYAQIQLDSETEFQDDDRQKIVKRAIELVKEWNETQYGASEESIQNKKVRCRNFLRSKLKEEHETFGFIGALATAIVFQLVVQLIVRWIMKKFFPEQ